MNFNEFANDTISLKNGSQYTCQELVDAICNNSDAPEERAERFIMLFYDELDGMNDLEDVTLAYDDYCDDEGMTMPDDMSSDDED